VLSNGCKLIGKLKGLVHPACRSKHLETAGDERMTEDRAVDGMEYSSGCRFRLRESAPRSAQKRTPRLGCAPMGNSMRICLLRFVETPEHSQHIPELCVCG